MPDKDWYEHRHELSNGMQFITFDGSLVELDRTVPGDGTKWYVLTGSNGRWFCEDATIEPSDLVRLVEANDAQG